MKHIDITKVTQEDIFQLQKIGRETFFETFSAENTEENMKSYLEEGFSYEKLMAEVTNLYSEFYFAKSEHEVVGYLKLNFAPSQTELNDNKSLEIERIYVLNEFHGKKVGQALYEKSLIRAKQKNLDYIWLGVWEKNLRAIYFYKKNGFLEFDKHVFKLGEDEQIDIMMKLQIK